MSPRQPAPDSQPAPAAQLPSPRRPAVGVLGACLFPLAPNWAKVAVFYLSSGLLILILGLLLLRGTLAAVTWIVSGRTLWLLPNLLSEVGGARVEAILVQYFK